MASTTMQENFIETLQRIATHPISFGLGAGLARWIMGDRDQGWKVLAGQILVSMFVAYAASAYLAEEVMGDGRRSFYVLLAAFVAKDLLLAVMAIAVQFARDPLALLVRVRDALKGSHK